MDYTVQWPPVKPKTITLVLSLEEFRIIARRMTDRVPECREEAELAHLIKSALTQVENSITEE